MDKIEFLETKFKSAFNEDQSQILTEVIYHNYEDLVKISDFTELKGIVIDSRNSQKKTESRFDDLAESLKRTDKKVDDLAESLKRTDKKVDDLAESLKKTDKKVDELAHAQKETDKKVDKLEKSVQNLARQVGGLSDSFGGSLEDFALDIVPEVLENNWNMSIDSAYREDFVLRGRTIEVDLIIEGTIQDKSIVVLCEVKSNLTLEEAKKFFLLVELIKDKFEAEIRVLFFGYRVKRDALEFIKDMGGFAISTRGLLL